MSIESNTIKKLLNPDELAAFLGISKSSIYRLIEGGKLPHYKVGGSIRFDKKDVLSYLEQNRVDSID